MRVPDGYTKYEGDYEKRWYNVLCKDGRYLHDCWPNAGTFSNGKGVRVDGSEVFAIKEVEDPYMREWQAKEATSNE